MPCENQREAWSKLAMSKATNSKKRKLQHDDETTIVSNKNKKQRQQLANKNGSDDEDYDVMVNEDDTSDWHSSDAYDDSSDDDDSTDSDEGAYNENQGSAHHGSGRWQGSAADKDKELQRKIDMEAKAQAYVFKQEQLNKQEMQVVAATEEPQLSEYSDDSDARAEIIALGQKMLRKKSREALIESTYNKYTWNDRDDLPEWFVEDESQHNTPQVPITKAEVLAVKMHFKAIDARPIHKIAEAKARKKRGETRRLERQKIHAENIMNQEGVSTEQKMRQLTKLASKKAKKEKVIKQYVMTEKSGNVRQSNLSRDNRGKKTWAVRVDRRMKRDKIGDRRAEWRKKHGKKKQ